MYISLLSLLTTVVFGAVAHPPSIAVPKFGGLNLLGCEPSVDLVSEIDFIASAANTGVNFFRIPISWQAVVRNNPASISFDATVLARYDRLVQEALASSPGAHVMIDLHNTAGWQTNDEDFANVWYNIADFFVDSRVIFGLMNEPHILDISSWAITVQGAVNAIRSAGATTQMIAIPGDSSLARPWLNGSNAALLGVTDLAAPTPLDRSKLIIDIQHRIDGDSTECSDGQLHQLATRLAKSGRRAVVSEISGRGAGSCFDDHLDFITNDKSFIGFALASQSSDSHRLNIQQHQQLFKRFLLPNQIPYIKPTLTRSSAIKRTIHRRTDPSGSPNAVNRQTFTGDLGSKATPVYEYYEKYIVKSLVFPNLLDALGKSCLFQRTACLAAAERSGYSGPLSGYACNIEQYQACLRVSILNHESNGHGAPANVQKFTAAVGGRASTTYPVLNQWVTNGMPFNDRVSALVASCNSQLAACSTVASEEECSAQQEACVFNASGSKSVIAVGYEYSGCMAEPKDNKRALSGAVLLADDMNQGKCVAWCKSQSFPLAGIEFGRECYCGSIVNTGASNTTLLPESSCNTPCVWNSNENCGGARAITLFNNPNMYPIHQLAAGWSEASCMTETASGTRALSGFTFAAKDMTPQKCMAECGKRNFKYAGVEYSSECYCGNSYTTGSIATVKSECNLACSGDRTQLCGGPKRLSTWTFDSDFVATGNSNRSLRFDRSNI